MTCEEVINKLKELDLGSASEVDIVQLMGQYGKAGAIVTKYHPAIGPDPVPNFFVRASNYNPSNESIIHTDRLRYPPLDYNTSYQRVSTPSRPMFYGVRFKSTLEDDMLSAIKTCLLETISDYDQLVKDGTRVAISLRYNVDVLNLYSVFNWNDFQEQNPENQEVVAAFTATIGELEEPFITNTRLILDYLSERFYIPVGEDESLYKPSSVISQYLLNKLGGYGIDGIVFPSTKVKGKELNVALNPDASDTKLSVCKVLDCEYLPHGIVQIQRRAELKHPEKDVHFNEDVKIDISLFD